jgi:hypothetical protein
MSQCPSILLCLLVHLFITFQSKIQNHQKKKKKISVLKIPCFFLGLSLFFPGKLLIIPRFFEVVSVRNDFTVFRSFVFHVGGVLCILSMCCFVDSLPFYYQYCEGACPLCCYDSSFGTLVCMR